MATDTRTFELRTYVAAPGQLGALLARFRDHTRALFEKHGMTNVGYWVATDDEGRPSETLVYLLAHASREAAKESWAAFQADPQWIAARDASEVDGRRLTASATSVYLDPTDFSELPDVRRMEVAMNLHATNELARDVDGTMATVADDPQYEFVSVGWRADGRDAVREAYRRLFADYDNRVLSSQARVLTVAPFVLCRESNTVRNSDHGSVNGQTMAVITFDGDLISGERLYSDPYTAKVTREALGADFGNIPGVTRIPEL